MKIILRILSDTQQPILSYVWKATLLALIPSLVIGVGVALAFPGNVPPLSGSNASVICGALIVSPWLETFLMWPVLSLIKRVAVKSTHIAVASAILWGLLHSLAAPVWGLGVLWPFFVFSICFLEWEKKSKRRAIGVTALVHTGQNLLPVMAILADR